MVTSETNDENQCSSKPEFISYDYKRKAVEYWLGGKNKKKFTTVQNQFKNLKPESQLYRWRDQV